MNDKIKELSVNHRSLDQDPQTYAIIGAAIEVNKMLGRGFLEAVYQEAFACEMTARNIPFEREAEIPVLYKGQKLQAAYRADFLCYQEVIVELKALDDITGCERAQVINYQKATGLSRALLINFGSSSLHHERLVNQYSGPHNLRSSAKSADENVIQRVRG